MAFEQHFEVVCKAILRGKVVPFLGAGVNLCNRPPGATWTWDAKDLLPSGGELAEALAEKLHRPQPVTCVNPECRCPQPERDLVKVSQEIVTYLKDGELRETVHSVFQGKPQVTQVHDFLASIGAAKNPNRDEDRYPLIVTTNYDDMMERAYRAKGLPYEVVFYRPEDGAAGSFYHVVEDGGYRVEDGAAKPIKPANAYPHQFCKHRPTILKIHGTIDRTSPPKDARFVITEDQYIDYLAQGALENLLPATLLAKLQNHYLLFLGYSLRDWNLRVFLRKLRSRFSAWAVLLQSSDAEEEFWKHSGVYIVPMDLKEYVERLGKELTVRSADADP
jgi:SIR2-like domain